MPVARPRVRRREYMRDLPFFSRPADSKLSTTFFRPAQIQRNVYQLARTARKLATSTWHATGLLARRAPHARATPCERQTHGMQHYLCARLADDQAGDLIHGHALNLHAHRSSERAVRAIRPSARGCSSGSASRQHVVRASAGPARCPRRGECRPARFRRTRGRPSPRPSPLPRTAPCGLALHTSAQILSATPPQQVAYRIRRRGAAAAAARARARRHLPAPRARGPRPRGRRPWRRRRRTAGQRRAAKPRARGRSASALPRTLPSRPRRAPPLEDVGPAGRGVSL